MVSVSNHGHSKKVSLIILLKGPSMKSRFFSKRDEFVLSTVTAFVVGGLLYQGFASLVYGKQHAVFQKNPVVVIKNKK
jgi:hypothetical protein